MIFAYNAASSFSTVAVCPDVISSTAIFCYMIVMRFDKKQVGLTLEIRSVVETIPHYDPFALHFLKQLHAAAGCCFGAHPII